MQQKVIKPGFERRLRNERERLGFSQADFAKNAGVKRITQYLYEKGDNVPNLRYLMAISVLGADLLYLLFETPFSNEPELRFSPTVLRSIYRIMDEIGQDEMGRLLPLESREEFFMIICAAYSGAQSGNIDVSSIPKLLKTAKQRSA